MCPAGEQKSETTTKQNKKLFFFSDARSVTANPFTLLLFTAGKAHGKVKSNFLPWAAPCFFTSGLGFWLSPLYVRRNKCPKKTRFGLKSLCWVGLKFCQLAVLAGAIPLSSSCCLCIWSAGTTRAPAANKGPLSGSAPLHSMTSAGPSHLQHETHTQRVGESAA